MADPISRPPRRTREIGGQTTPPATVLPPINEAQLLMPDLGRMQDIQYGTLIAEAAEYARTRDEQYPLWSMTHTYRPQAQSSIDLSWKTNWQNVAQLYIYYSLTHEEIARFSAIPKRSIEAHSGKYGWKQARRTHKALQESEDIPDLKDLEEEVRKQKIAEFLTQSGFEVARHAMQALLQNVDKVSPRDVPALLMAATKVLSMGTQMPESYRHSRVENPLAAAAQSTNVNILNISPAQAQELLESLNARRLVLEEAKAVSVQAALAPTIDK